MNQGASVKMALCLVLMFLLPLAFHAVPPAQLVPLAEDSVEHTQGRAQTTWSGTQTLTGTYTIGVADEVIIQPCTVVRLPANERIVVDGRLTVLGTQSCPVILEASGLGDHEGIQFNASSSGRGSLVQNLTIEDAIYGVTVYASNPVMENLTVVNPDRVAVDLFSSASPRITDLYVDRAGRDLGFQGDWRYGLGLSIGSGSTPIVQRAVFSDILTRAVNIWGGSGGLIQGITVDNCSGSSWAMVAGIWVEDSQPLLTNISISSSDSGIVIRHIDDGGYTHAVVRHAHISDSMYRGVYVDKNDHLNYTNYETADFTNLTITGTGGPNAKTPNIGYAALEVNATGAWFDDTLIEDSTTVGVRLYFVDSTTTFRNLTVRNSGDPGQGPHEAGIAVRSSFFAPTFDGLEVSGSVGPGVHSTSGGAMQGSDWVLHNNTKQGVIVDRATMVVEGMHFADNGYSAAHVLDARRIDFWNLTAENNGDSASAAAEEQAGLYYFESNNVESASGDVRCWNCSISGSAGQGILAVNSVDLWLESIHLADNNPSLPAFEVDNGDTMPGGASGRVHVTNAHVDAESPGQPAVKFHRAAVEVNGLTMAGNHTGLDWRGDNNGQFASILNNSVLSGTQCALFEGHASLSGHGNRISTACTGSITLTDSQVNWSGLIDDRGGAGNPTVLNLDATSNLHLHQPVHVSAASAALANGATLDVAWDLTVWVINNYSNGIPGASVNVTFASFEPSVTLPTDDDGTLFLPDFISQRWTASGASALNTAQVDCGYFNVENTTTVSFGGDLVVYCHLPLANQAPFVRWTSPEDGAVFPSGAEVFFNASDSWDLDNDDLVFKWRSSLDDDIIAGCSGVFNSNEDPADGAPFLANGDSSTQTPPYCQLSDGMHEISLQVCDIAHCVEEIRIIELVNFAPVLVVDFEPALNPWSELIMPQTGTVTVNTTGTFDPEGDDFACVIDFNGEGAGWGSQWACPDELTYTFDYKTEDPPASATLTVMAFDAVGNNATYSVPVLLFNEIPDPLFTVSRSSNASESMVTLDGSATVDPEGDALSATFTSSLDGVLQVGSELVWEGHLSRGVHTITMEVTDDRAEHANQTKSTSILLTVDNAEPVAVIASPPDQTFDSSEMISFSANGSGDYDAACFTFPLDGEWVCSEVEPATGSEFLVVTWTSSLDGRLTPEGEDWLLFERRLSAGEHEITLSVDDGIHEPITTTRTITVTPSAPILGLVSPQPGSVHPSSTTFMLDASESVDFDGDEFTITLRSSETSEPLLVEVDPYEQHAFNLNAGEHQMTVTLTDETGASRDEGFALTVVESGPVLVLISPENRQSIVPGGALVLEEASYDADNDLTVREWRRYAPELSEPEVLSTRSKDELTGLLPGEYHLSLYVEDARGNSVEEHVNITIQSSLPSLDRNSLSLSSETFTQNELNVLTVRIALSDPDGTTKDVRVNITLGMQQWEANLADEDGDGVWEGSLEWRPETTGRPLLKVVAKDGEGDQANIDFISRNLVVEAPEDDMRGLLLGAGALALLSLAGLLAFVMSRRRRALEEIDLLTSWDAFKAPSQEATSGQKSVPALEGNAMDGTDEVQAELETEFDLDVE
ncbi:MAG: right-handed parallel beta-helix repeat-containing protein [Poseidonia sp.]